MLIMRPPPDFRIRRAPCWQQKNTAFRFTEWMKSQSASVMSIGSKRLAAPVTRMTLPASSDGLLSMYFHLVGVDSFQLRLGNPARIVGPGPEDRGHRAQGAGPGADGSRAVVLRSDSGHHHRDHH